MLSTFAEKPRASELKRIEAITGTVSALGERRSCCRMGSIWTTLKIRSTAFRGKPYSFRWQGPRHGKMQRLSSTFVLVRLLMKLGSYSPRDSFNPFWLLREIKSFRLEKTITTSL